MHLDRKVKDNTTCVTILLQHRIKGITHLRNRRCRTFGRELPQSHNATHLRDNEVEGKGNLPVLRRIFGFYHFHNVRIFRNRQYRVSLAFGTPHFEGFSVTRCNKFALRIAELIFFPANKFRIVRRENYLNGIGFLPIRLVKKACIFSVCKPIIRTHRKTPIGFLSAPYMPDYRVWQSFLPIIILYSSAHFALIKWGDCSPRCYSLGNKSSSSPSGVSSCIFSLLLSISSSRVRTVTLLSMSSLRSMIPSQSGTFFVSVGSSL